MRPKQVMHSRHNTKSKSVKTTARCWYNDNTTGYFSFNMVVPESYNTHDILQCVEESFREDLKEVGEEYPHGGSRKFKVISIDGVKVNKIVQ